MCLISWERAQERDPHKSGNEAHKLFLGAPNRAFWVGAKKFMLKKFLCFFGPLKSRNSLGSLRRASRESRKSLFVFPRLFGDSPGFLGRRPRERFSRLFGPEGSERPLHVSAVNLWGRSGRGHCRKFSANFREISQTFRRISAPFPGAIKLISLQISANFLQNFRKLSAKTPSLTTP